MENNTWLLFSPFLIMIMGIIILYGLVTLNRTINDWRLISLSLIPVSLILLYGWVVFFAPFVETVRLVMRLVIILDMGIATHVIAEYIKSTKGGK